jgi:hypothetical protein
MAYLPAIELTTSQLDEHGIQHNLVYLKTQIQPVQLTKNMSSYNINMHEDIWQCFFLNLLSWVRIEYYNRQIVVLDCVVLN